MRIIDLNSSEGNVFSLLGISRSWAKQININPPDLAVVKREDGSFRPAENYNEVLDNFDAFWQHRIDYEFLHDPRKQEEDDEE